MQATFEIIGYIGTALVILSMTMTSVRRLRAINVIGSAFSTAYAIFGGAWPIVIMNLTLSAINIYHLIRGREEGREDLVAVRATDAALLHFLAANKRALARQCPELNARITESDGAYILYKAGAMVGVLCARVRDNVLYATAAAHSLADRESLYQRAQEFAKAANCREIVTDAYRKTLREGKETTA